METYQYFKGYTDVIDKIETIIDLLLEENNKNLAVMSEQLQGLLKGKGYDKEIFNDLLNKSSEFAEQICGMYAIKHKLMFKARYLRKETLRNDYGTDEDFKAGQLAAVQFIEDVIGSSKEYFKEIPDNKKVEYQEMIQGAEIILECLKHLKEIDVDVTQ